MIFGTIPSMGVKPIKYDLPHLLARASHPKTALLSLLSLPTEQFIAALFQAEPFRSLPASSASYLSDFLDTKRGLAQAFEEASSEQCTVRGRKSTGLNVAAVKTFIALEHLRAGNLNPQSKLLWLALVNAFCPDHHGDKHTHENYSACYDKLEARMRQFKATIEESFAIAGLNPAQLLSYSIGHNK